MPKLRRKSDSKFIESYFGSENMSHVTFTSRRQEARVFSYESLLEMVEQHLIDISKYEVIETNMFLDFFG